MSVSIEPLTMSTRQAAALLGVGRNKLLRLLQTKRIKAKDLDGRLRFTTESLREFLDALPDALEAERHAPSANATPASTSTKLSLPEIKSGRIDGADPRGAGRP